MMDENDDPRAPYKVYEGDEQKAHTRRVLKRGGVNSNSKAPISPAKPTKSMHGSLLLHSRPPMLEHERADDRRDIAQHVPARKKPIACKCGRADHQKNVSHA